MMSDAVHSLLNNPHPGARSITIGDFPLDKNVIAHFPNGTKVLSADNYRSSACTVTARINVELADGTPKRYFFKCATEEAGRVMMEGEFEAMTELYRTVPSLVPPPLAKGKFERENPAIYFFVCDFVDMSNQHLDS